ncbi:MAG: hypothetical protein PHG91_00425 [Syntrophales bacterium]|nr:hypothetical protein [Syntrophales bacterium]MDD5231834.1 hypothetical protein [Syntrophales bacterium]MDD5531362.1 hypothetical protein [Syntrophales bacterium]
MVRGVDIQQVLIQSNSVERVQQVQQQHPDLQQRYLEVQIKEERKISKESVKNTPESEHARIQEKPEQEKSPRQEAGGRQAGAGEKEDGVEGDDPEGEKHLIDIRV